LATRYKCITIMKKYTKTKVIRISEVQLKTLQKMKSYNVDIGKFIRDAIAEKIKNEYKDLLPKTKKQYCPFSGGTIEIDEYGKEIEL
jgi:hypothetical protein